MNSSLPVLLLLPERDPSPAPPAMPAVEVMFGTLSLLCFLIGTPLSCFCLLFFARKPRKTINIIMFILISATDMVICVMILFVGLSAFHVHVFFDTPFFCNLWGMLWSISIKLSIVMIAVLSITRTVSILSPLSKVSGKWFLGAVVGYLLLFTLHSTVPYWFGLQYTYFVRTARCTWDDIEVYGWGEGKVVEYVLTPIITYLLPTLTVVVCFTFLVWGLMSRAHVQAQQTNSRRTSSTVLPGRPPRISVISVASTMSMRADAKIHSTITVLILAVFYIALTVPSTVFRIVGYTHELRHKEPYNLTVSYNVFRLVTTYFLPINSVCNTIVYFVRIRDLRIFTCKLLGNLYVRAARRRESVLSSSSRTVVNSVPLASILTGEHGRGSAARKTSAAGSCPHIVEFCEVVKNPVAGHSSDTSQDIVSAKFIKEPSSS